MKVEIFYIIAFLIVLVAGAVFLLNDTTLQKIQSTPTPTASSASDAPQTSSPPSENPSEVTVLEPKAGSTVKSPFVIKGQAPGSWLFEGQTIARLERTDGTIITQSILLAESEWMTVEQVNFSGSMKFTKPAGVTEVNLVIVKENPSGLPENDDSFIVPLKLEM